MGKIKLFGLVMGVATMAMAQNPSTSTLSRELSATAPVTGYYLYTDGHINKWGPLNNLASGTAMTVTQTRQTVASVTNATVGGAALSGVTTVWTNATVTVNTNFVYLSATGVTNTATIVTAVAGQTGTPIVSAPTITLQLAPVAALTNVTVAVP
jgi:hypothetical protein